MNEPTPISVLIVDDDPEIRELLAPVLHGRGFNVAEAATAAQALALVLQHPFDVVITDVRMPRDSGIELLQKIKKYRPNIQVFIMTGNPDNIDAPSADGLAAAVFLKPFRPQTLVDAVRLACRPVPLRRAVG